MKSDRILVIAAHPDDEVLGCGASLSKWNRSGAKIQILIMGEGTSCRFSPREILERKIEIEAEKKRRFSQLEEAMQVLNIKDYSIGHGICGRFDTQALIDFTKLIESHIDEFKPNTLITHSYKDANNDHRLTHHAVMIATRPVKGHPVRKVLNFEIPSSTEWNFSNSFTPNFFVDVSETIQDKLNAFSRYAETEGRPFPFPRSDEAITALARYRGAQCGAFAAEAFEVMRSIED